MATLVFTALGTALGGPLGGAIGSLVGSQLDRALIGSPKREGPRLKELAVTTSSYGTPLARHFGTMRAAGSVIWATNLVESSEGGGGGKGAPSTTSYSYSASFAVALASRPIQRLGRVWADGNLLRGAAGDLKTGGVLRVYCGHGDQEPDPLIAADRGGACPAFRGRAYCVFESLQLSEFGNRIPTLTFEIVADDGEITLEQLLEPVEEPIVAARPLGGLTGFSDEGGPLAGTLAALDQIYPLACDAGGEALSIGAADALPVEPALLPEAAVDDGEEGFGGGAGKTRRRQANAGEVPDGLRYYDTSRDYQAGVQRAAGRARPGRSRIIEFPGALDAGNARALANAAAERAGWSRETLAWRVAELDPTLAPGQVVRVPTHAGLWRIDSWEWRERGIELELRRLPSGGLRLDAADPGEALPAADLVAGPSVLIAYELPWDGLGSGEARQAFAAASSESAGWTGAALYLEQAGGGLVPLGTSGSRRSIVGAVAAPVSPSAALLLEREATVEVELVSEDFELPGASVEALTQGANRALIGGEVLQFAAAERVWGKRWRLRGLLRGRGGTESAAMAGHAIGTAFVLLDATPRAIDPAMMGQPGEATLAAIGLADSEPVLAPLLNPWLTTRPLSPVHPPLEPDAAGGVALSWTRRARGAWAWLDGVDAPLGEETEHYLVGIGDPDVPAERWETAEPRLALAAATWATLVAAYPGQALWVRQIGRHTASPPMRLATLT